ncbi:MAG: hypothetical protein Q4E89_10490, partial [Eubacteriales bacterium]|nr:hypothetical protein [Eubacteriales bacterium]
PFLVIPKVQKEPIISSLSYFLGGFPSGAGSPSDAVLGDCSILLHRSSESEQSDLQNSAVISMVRTC